MAGAGAGAGAGSASATSAQEVRDGVAMDGSGGFSRRGGNLLLGGGGRGGEECDFFFLFGLSLRLKTKARRGGGENLTMGGGGAGGGGGERTDGDRTARRWVELDFVPLFRLVVTYSPCQNILFVTINLGNFVYSQKLLYFKMKVVYK